MQDTTIYKPAVQIITAKLQGEPSSVPRAPERNEN